MEKVTENNQSRISSLDKAYEEYRQKCVKNGLGIDNDDEITKKIIKGDITPEQLETIEGKILPEEQFKAYYYPKELSGETKLKNNYRIEKTISKNDRRASSTIQVLPDGRIVTGYVDGKIKVFIPKGDIYQEQNVGWVTGGGVYSFQILDDNRIVLGTDDIGILNINLSDMVKYVYSMDVIWKQLSKCEYLDNYVIRAIQVLPDNKVMFAIHNKIYSLIPQSDGKYIQKEIKLIGQNDYESSNNHIRTFQVLSNGGIVVGTDNGIDLLIPKLDGQYERQKIGEDTGLVWVLQVLSDGRIITGEDDKNIYKWTPEYGGKYKKRRIGKCNELINSLQVLSSGKIITGSHNGTIAIWN